MSKASDIAKQRRVFEGREPVWICGKVIGDGKWSFQGVFSDELGAVGACQDESYFIAPAKMNQALPAADSTWAGLYFPLKVMTRVSA
jgi:hypothetical protein